MKKIFLFTFLIFSLKSFAQLTISLDTTYVKMSKGEYVKLKKYNDSISKIKISPDTTSYYEILKIEDLKTFYIIYAKGIANDKNEYFYRIKSLKVKNKGNCEDLIKAGKSYQLDLRDYKNHNQRLHFIPGVALNLITHGGFSSFDIIIHLDEKLTKDEFNVALNLQGLCIVK
ncbi:hypothetical protein [Flavobacterium panacagri]|uniref:hypothetical protein n=1 Tax=Flavobacterium panacagri TaxID=3034146 RepID=UPI0025A62698|nr:hypothetical protein [Flavobacterium panacagri]